MEKPIDKLLQKLEKGKNSGELIDKDKAYEMLGVTKYSIYNK